MVTSVEPSSVPPKKLVSIIDTRSIVRQVASKAFMGSCGRTLFNGNRRMGTLYEDSDATYCFFEEVVAANLSAPRANQTTQIFETIERILHAEGMDFRHLVRTWFYLDKILEWYDDFNLARTTFLETRGVFEHLVPASTGIGIPNRFGAPVVTGALAIKPKRATVIEVPSPLQCPAIAYKSSFSRAVEITHSGRRELYISGTASIEANGKTAHIGDTKAQINLTMEVVAAILKSRQMDWSHTTRAIAYIKEAKEAPLFTQYLRRHGLEKMPLTWVHADVCRDDLLFEIELDARVIALAAHER